MAVHSTQLGAHTGITTAGVTLYTVPAGKRTIVKSVCFQSHAAASQRVFIVFSSATAGDIALGVTVGAIGSATESMNYECWVVLNAGDKLKVVPVSDNVDAIASGAELVL